MNKIFQVTNKVFAFFFWTEEDAIEFASRLPPSSGFHVLSYDVLGKNPYLEQESTPETK